MRARQIALSLIVIGVVAAGTALAAGGGPQSVKLCAAKSGGALRAPATGGCARSERKLVLLKNGARGPRGRLGPTGARGLPGPNGVPPQTGAPILIQDGAGDCRAILVFCSTPGGYWHNFGNGYAPVGYRVDPGGFVHLQGLAGETGSGTTPAIFYLPAELAPPQGVSLKVRTCNGVPGSVFIGVDGVVEGAPIDCLPLDGIVFHP